MTTAGQFPGIPAAEYHAADAISHSRLEVFRKRPALYYKRFVAKTILPEETKAYDFGRAAHALILEGQKVYRDIVAVWRLGNKVKAKAEWQLFQTEYAGRPIITAEEEKALWDMETSISEHPEARALLMDVDGEAETTCRVNTKKLPLPLQCRPDWFCGAGCELSGGKPFVVDLKTTPSLDSEDYANFQKSFVKYGYHRQAGFYTALMRDLGVELSNFFFVAVEKEEPYGVDVYRAADSAVGYGLTETLADMEGLSRSYSTDTWPNRPAGINEISCPDWYIKKQPLLS